MYVGRDKYGTNILVDFDRRAEDKTTSNILILGNSGQGKSYLLKLILTNIRESGKAVICLDPESEYEELCSALGGCYIDFMSGEHIINPLEPKAWADGVEEIDAGTPEAFRRVTRLSQHIAFLKDFFRSYKDFSDTQIDTIEILLTKLYARFGITDSTDYTNKSPMDYPVMEDFYKLCEEEYYSYDNKRKYLYTEETLQNVCLGIHSMCVGAESKYFNGHTNITDSRFLVFGVKGLMDTNKRLKDAMLFNNEGHHPHVHLLIYSTNPKQGFLSKKGIDKLRSSIAQEIFHQDLMNIYEKQTEHRDELRAKSRDMIAEIASRINSGEYDNPTLEGLLLDLAFRLSKAKGKKQYGYLKADVKAIVDGMVRELAADSNIAALYDLWYRKREEIIRTYTDELPKRIPLEDNPEFKSIKNAVIREAIKLARNTTKASEQVANNEQGEADEQLEEDEADRNRAGSNDYTHQWNQTDNRSSKYAHPHSPTQHSNTRPAARGVIRLMHHLCRMLQNGLDSDRSRRLERIDRKLKRKIDEKKQAHGLKQG